MARSIAVLAVFFFLSGCIETPPPQPDVGADVPLPGPRLGTDLVPEFSVPKIVDSLRAGGEPVIAVTGEGTVIISAHPGYTHWHPDATAVPPTSAELVAPTQMQSYLWRSTDGGETFTHVTLLPVDGLPNSGPRGVGQGVSDPDLTIDGNGRIWLTDLEGLAQASVSWSDDDGESWIFGNNLASGGPIDRQWLASHGSTVYFTGNYFTDQRLLASEDGLVFERRGDVPCGGDIVADPQTGHLYAGCGGGIAVSTDGGYEWERPESPLGAPWAIEAEPAIDANGTVYVSGIGGEEFSYAYTRDHGKTWQNHSLASFFPELANGTIYWPWTSAGSAGRIAVTFFGSTTPEAQDDVGSEWFVYTALILDADSDSPTIYPVKLTPEPHHRGAICTGTVCQATTATDEGSDRRMGDFFETTIDSEGFLHVAYSDTQNKPSDTISHVGYVRLLEGPRLVEGELAAGLPTQG